VVLRVEFGRTVFLFTGDADVKSENDQLTNGLSLKADVLKVGHHGSRTSSAQKYLDAVTPKYAVISLGTDNPYGHPHSETMERLTGMGVEVYRTDEDGTVSFITDGETITINTERQRRDHN
jgi:beta-lactamase superfamily II metal-dependent hydrolase